jgi:hypothetical protein
LGKRSGFHAEGVIDDRIRLEFWLGSGPYCRQDFYEKTAADIFCIRFDRL